MSFDNILSNSSYTNIVSTRLRRRFANVLSKSPDEETENLAVIPFQFWLHLLPAIYADWVKDAFKKNPEKADHELESIEKKRLEEYNIFAERGELAKFIEVLEGDNNETHLAGTISRKKVTDMDLDVISVGFFSWEPNDSCFLARRFYPHTADLMSYSYCNPHWGILRYVIDEVKKGHTGLVTSEKVTPVDLLPYLFDKHQLGHEAALAFPIGLFDKSSANLSDLYGAIIFFLKRVPEDNWASVKNLNKNKSNELGKLSDTLARVAMQQQQAVYTINIGPTHPEKNGRHSDLCQNTLNAHVVKVEITGKTAIDIPSLIMKFNKTKAIFIPVTTDENRHTKNYTYDLHCCWRSMVDCEVSDIFDILDQEPSIKKFTIQGQCFDSEGLKCKVKQDDT